MKPVSHNDAIVLQESKKSNNGIHTFVVTKCCLVGHEGCSTEGKSFLGLEISHLPWASGGVVIRGEPSINTLVN